MYGLITLPYIGWTAGTALGALAGGGVYALLETVLGPATGSLAQSLAYVVVAGVVALVVTFVPAVVMRLPEASMISSITRRFS